MEALNLRIKNSMNNILTGLLGQVILTITGFVTRTVFINILGSTYLGVSGLFSNILTVLSFAELGVGQAIVFSLYKPIAEKDEEKICSLMQLYSRIYHVLFVVVLVLGLIILPFLPFIIHDIDSIPYIRLIYVMYVFNSASTYLFSYRGTFVTASQQNYIINIMSFGCNIIMSIVQIISLLVFRNYLVYLSIQIVFGIIQNALTYIYSSRRFPFLKKKNIQPLEKRELTKIKEDIKALILYKIGTISLNSTDNIIISSFVGVVGVGLYSNYLLLQTSVSAFLTTVFNNLTASIGNLNAKETREKRIFMFNVINLATFWFYAVCSICLFVCMTPFIRVWIGADYVLPISVSLIIAVNMYIGGMLFAPFNYRQTMGIFVEGKWRPIISAIINIVVSIIFAKWWGIAGVLWGTAVARLTTNVWFDPYLVFKRGMNTSPINYYIDYLKKLLEVIVIGVICWFVTNKIPDTNVIYLFIKGIISFIISSGTILLLHYKTKEFQYLWNVFKNFKNIMHSKE